jgi:glycosyltransferase involved in cell wall biosynthesis
MKILYVTDQYWPTVTGVSVSVDSFKSELEKMGHTVYIFTSDYPNAEEFDRKRKTKNLYRFKSAPILVNKDNRLVVISERKKIHKLIDQINPDIIHLQTEFTLCKMCKAYARKKKYPIVITAHTNWEDFIHIYIPLLPTKFLRYWSRHYLRSVFKHIDVVVTPTSLMELLLHLYFIKNPVRIIPTGIEVQPKSKRKIKEDIPTANKAVVKKYPILKNKEFLLFAGRMGKEKNIEFAIDAFENLKNEFNNLMFLIVGDGPEIENLKQYVKDKCLEERIIFTGFIDRKNLNDYYKSAAVFCFPSKTESQGLVVLEAMAQGTPVVAIGKMGTREVMGGDNGGFMVDDDIHEFTMKVKMLLNNKKLYRKKSKEAYHHAGKWSLASMAEKMDKLYKSVLRNRSLNG